MNIPLFIKVRKLCKYFYIALLNSPIINWQINYEQCLLVLQDKRKTLWLLILEELMEAAAES